MQRPWWFLVPVAFLAVLSASAQTAPPAPVPDPLYVNVFYGGTNPAFSSFNTPVLVFVNGLNGVAQDWFQKNDMYADAYQYGFRTAFVNPDPHNKPAAANIQTNATVLESMIPRVAAHFNTSKLYLIGHSKGGLDLQAAILSPVVAPLVKAVFTVATPNTGTELADWAFQNPSLAGPYNLLTPAVKDMTLESMTAYRTQWDPLFEQSLLKPFYTIAGDIPLGNPSTELTGVILAKLVPFSDFNSLNDGLVTVGHVNLSPEFSNNLGMLDADHFQMNQGHESFFKIFGRIEALETQTDEFQRIAVNGFTRFGGSPHNSWAWSMKWFNGKLYVGTGREEFCLSLYSDDVHDGSKLFSWATKADVCPDYSTLAQSMQAEIWEYTPGTNTWRRAYQSPASIPLTIGGKSIMTGRDAGFRSMAVFTEKNGTQALYVGGVTSGSAFEPTPYQNNGYPPPRILRTTDGINWTALPQDPGTTLGEIGNMYLSTNTKVRSWRALTVMNGMLFATAADFDGSGVVFASSNPSAGDNAWQQVSPDWSTLPVWDMVPFNNMLYVTTGFTKKKNPNATGYGVYKAALTGKPPYTFLPVIINGAWQSNAIDRAPNGLSMNVFRNELYVGTNRPTELIRIRPDDTWDLLVGEPRMTPAGNKRPLTGLGIGFGNQMTGHFWRQATEAGPGPGQNMFLGTWDWGVLLQAFGIPTELDQYFTHQYGTDVWRSEDGTHFSAETQAGFGDPNNSGTRSLEPTPAGLFLGTARQRDGAEVFVRNHASTNPVPAPRRLRAESEVTAGRNVNLAWDPPPGSYRFNIYRATAVPVNQLIANATFSMPLPNGQTVSISIQDFRAGKYSSLCTQLGVSDICAEMQIFLMNATASFPQPFTLIAQTAGTSYSEPAPTTLDSLYYVRAVDSSGRLSDPSNVVGGPSKADSIPALACDVDGDGFVDSNDITEISEANGSPAYGPNDPRDANKDGQINVLDTRMCATKCSKAGCALQ